MWKDWKQQLKDNPDVKVDKQLLWEYDMNDFDWQKSRHIVTERVVNVGGTNLGSNMLALFKMYGGYEEVKKIMKNEVVRFSNVGEEYVCEIFDLKREELESYKRNRNIQRTCNRVIFPKSFVPDLDWKSDSDDNQLTFATCMILMPLRTNLKDYLKGLFEYTLVYVTFNHWRQRFDFQLWSEELHSFFILKKDWGILRIGSRLMA